MFADIQIATAKQQKADKDPSHKIFNIYHPP